MELTRKCGKVCRTCLRDDSPLSQLDDEFDNEIQGMEMLEFLLGRQIDGDFKEICSLCRRKLTEFYAFKHQCLKSEEKILAAAEEYCTQKSAKSEKLHGCRRCKITFLSRTAYDRHYKTEHGKITLCELCGKKLLKSQLERHKATHSDQKSFCCSVCDAGFTTRQSLEMHMRIHTNDKRYNCKLCGEKFVHWSGRRAHIRAKHTAEKSFECPCGRRFSHSSSLLKHRRSHAGELRHECSVCQKGFARNRDLHDHMVTHTGERNEICSVCGKAFGVKKSLRTHMMTHTGERNYPCAVCKKSFTQCHVLRSHIKAMHPEHPLPPPGTVLSRKARKG